MSTATALVDLEHSTVHAKVEIAAPPARVFRAITQPRQLAAWWGDPALYRTDDWQLELRAGAPWSCKAIAADGSISSVRGVVEQVEAPHRLVMTWSPSWDDFADSTIVYRLSATPSGTLVEVTHSGFASAAACQSHGDGWVRVLGWLTDKLADVPE